MAYVPRPKLPRTKPTGLQLAKRKLAQAKATERKLTTAALRELARAHTEAALQVLADVATMGSSEASRISAAMALLDRGYGKSGAGATGDDGGPAPVLYQRIVIVDGTGDSSERDQRAADGDGPDD